MLATLVFAIALQTHSPNGVTERVAQICSVRIVGFKFIGVEGQKFELGSESYTIEKSGFVELISEGETTFRYGGKVLPLTVWPKNGFGFLEVPLPPPDGSLVERSVRDEN